MSYIAFHSITDLTKFLLLSILLGQFLKLLFIIPTIIITKYLKNSVRLHYVYAHKYSKVLNPCKLMCGSEFWLFFFAIFLGTELDLEFQVYNQ